MKKDATMRTAIKAKLDGLDVYEGSGLNCHLMPKNDWRFINGFRYQIEIPDTPITDEPTLEEVDLFFKENEKSKTFYKVFNVVNALKGYPKKTGSLITYYANFNHLGSGVKKHLKKHFEIHQGACQSHHQQKLIAYKVYRDYNTENRARRKKPVVAAVEETKQDNYEFDFRNTTTHCPSCIHKLKLVDCLECSSCKRNIH